MKDTHRDEQLKDRRAYRQTLIHKREEIDAKIERTEKSIKALTKSEKATA